jgi:hypothetical protein
MATEKYPVQVAVKDEQGKIIHQGTLKVSDKRPVDSRTFDNLSAGKYKVEYTPPDGFVVSPSKSSDHTLTGDRNTLKVGIELKESTVNESSSSQANSFSEPVPSPSPLAKILWLTPISLLVFGSLKLPIDFLPNTALTISRMEPVKFLPTSKPNYIRRKPEIIDKPRFASEGGQPVATSLSKLDNQLKKCLITNIRDISGIPTFVGLVRNLTLVEVPNEALRKEATQLYDQAYRFRKILDGCDPKLGSELLAANSPETNSIQPTSFGMPMVGMAQSLRAITIWNCHGKPHSANFRSTPAIANWAILGMVRYGQPAYLTGRIQEADGVVWHQVIAPTAVADPGRYIAPNQPGWIAGCFVQ